MALPKQAQIVSAVLLATVFVGSALYLNHPESSASSQSTNDAYIQADFTTVAAQVSGTVSKILIVDNQLVRGGDLLAELDDRVYVAAMDAATAQVANAKASIASLDARLAQQQIVIRQAQLGVDEDDAALSLASENEIRYRKLAADGSGSVQLLQQAETQLRIQQARREMSLAGLQHARQQVAILSADLAKARAMYAQTQANLAAAALNLSFTKIIAPIDGSIGQKSLRIGGFVTVGKPLLAIIPLDKVYITANFRETQLARVRTGQEVDVVVDALPNVRFEAVVSSVGPASGATYSVLAPHNASGNFTKIVQRLPVRIALKPGQAAAEYLRLGMSVTPTIYINE